MRHLEPLMSATAGPVRCLLVDDSATYLAAAEALLSTSGIEVVGAVRTTGAAVRAAIEERPDIVVLALEVAQDNGFQLVHHLAAMASAPVVLLVTARDPDSYTARLAELPVAGCLAKERLSIHAVHTALRARSDSRPRDDGRAGQQGGATSGRAGHDEPASQRIHPVA